MNSHHSYFAELANRSGRGSQSAKVPMQLQMEQDMAYIVHRALRQRDDQSTLGRRIFAEARRQGLDDIDGSLESQDRLVQQVARCLCNKVMAGLRSPPREANPLQDTVCHQLDTIAHQVG